LEVLRNQDLRPSNDPQHVFHQVLRMPEQVVEVDLGVTPEAAVSGAVLIQTEHRAFLTFNAMRPTNRPFPHGGFYKEDAGTAVVELIGCSLTKFGYPNDEAWRNIPRTKGLVYGIYEVCDSDWIQAVVTLNQFSFPKTSGWGGRHFLFLFHDSSFECIARDLRLELRSQPYSTTLAEITAHID
jgi:hypothetical protein